MRRKVVGVQSRELRTAKHALACLFQSLRRALPAHTGLGSPSAGPPLNPANANRAYLDNTESHFPRIGVLSAQRTGDTVSNYRRLKYRSCSHEEEQMPRELLG